MTIDVKGYQRHINGKLVTVHGYSANRDVFVPTQGPPKATPVYREHVDRASARGMAPPGTYAQPRIMQGVGGLTAYLYKPGTAPNDIPEYRWRRTRIPYRGAYHIPERKAFR